MDYVVRKYDITRSTLSAIENGKGNYSIDTLLRILNILNLNFEIDFIKSKDRLRASRINTALMKKVNRFIIMSIEQYALSIGESSALTYEKLNETGIIDELKEDYEDMHGMSIKCINDYIDKTSVVIPHQHNNQLSKIF